MSLINGLRHRLLVLLQPARYQRELDEEFRFHLSLEEMQQTHAQRHAARHSDLPADEARYAAERRFGNELYLKEESRRMAGLGFFDMVRQDLRFAVRSFRRSPGFTLVAAMTLAVGIGANTAIFSAMDALLLRPLPFREPEQLMQVSLMVPPRGAEPPRADMVWSYPKFTALRDAQTVFSNLTLFSDDQFTIRGDGEVERDWGEVSDAGYLPTLGLTPSLGRNFLPEEDLHPGGPKVVMLGDVFWKRRYNADPRVLGKVLDIDGQQYTIVGVGPSGFHGLSGRADFWIPILSRPADDVNQAWMHSFTLIARRKPGITVQQSDAAVQQLGVQVDRAYPHPEIKDEHWGAMERELNATRLKPGIRRSVLVLFGAVGLVLLIACANVANLFLVRAAGRRREIAVRLAVGASRGRLIRQLLTESMLLSVSGGVAGIAVAWWGVHALSALIQTTLRGREISGLAAIGFASIRLDGSALLFAGALAIGTGLLFGLVPALQATHPSLTAALKGSGDSVAGHRKVLTSRNLLVVVEIALAVVLLSGSGLMLRSLNRLLNVDQGFEPSGLLTARFNSPEGLGRDSLPGFYDQILTQTAGLPGVRDVALEDCPPLSGGCNGTLIVFRDRPPPVRGTEPDVGIHWVTPTWATALKVPLKRGRFFTSSDRQGQQKVVVVNEAAVKAFWPNQDPIGRPVSVGQGGFWTDTAYVIGVVGDVRYGTPDSLAKPDVYLSYNQSPAGRMMLFVRTDGNPLSLAGPARHILAGLAPDMAVYDVQTMEDRIVTATSYARFSTLMLVLFGVVALGLATLGTYGVISFLVSQRTHEIGIRMALGATHTNVVRLVVGEGAKIAAVGGIIGLGVAFATTRVLRSLLYEIAPSDPATFLGIVVILGVAVFLASWVPARRAAGIAPTEALREE